ncbi:tyrosine recombinase XerS [Caldibacillus debilis]|nr:tyrosine recombinase XerS [Caldibacillus debilis]
MARSLQHEYFEKRLEDMLKEMPPFVVAFIDDKLDHRSPLTLFNYLRDFRSFFSWLMAEGIVQCESIRDFPVEALADLPLDDVKTYFKWLSRRKYTKGGESEKLNQRTVNRHISALRSLFHYLTVESETKNGKPYFERNVMAKIPVYKVKETINERARKISQMIFTDDRDIEFLDYVKNHYENTLSPAQKRYFKRDKERDYAILSLFLGSGMRVNELSNLRLRDIDLAGNTVQVVRKGDKKDVIAVTPSAMNDLKDYLLVRKQRYNADDNPNDFVFVKKEKGKASPLTNRAIENIVYKYTQSFDKRMSPHKLRHTYATNLAKETGGDIPLIMTQLGHTDSDTSLLYVHSTIERQREAAEKLDARRKNHRNK